MGNVAEAGSENGHIKTQEEIVCIQFSKHSAGKFYSPHINSSRVIDKVPKESLDPCAAVP